MTKFKTTFPREAGQHELVTLSFLNSKSPWKLYVGQLRGRMILSCFLPAARSKYNIKKWILMMFVGGFWIYYWKPVSSLRELVYWWFCCTRRRTLQFKLPGTSWGQELLIIQKLKPNPRFCSSSYFSDAFSSIHDPPFPVGNLFHINSIEPCLSASYFQGKL